jgi:hypothetical protein
MIKSIAFAGKDGEADGDDDDDSSRYAFLRKCRW